MPPSPASQLGALVLPAAGRTRGAETVLPGAGRRRRGLGAHGFAGLGRPRRETPAAPGRPEPAALAAAAPARSLGRRITWPPGASLPGTCNPLPARPAPRGPPGGALAAPRAPISNSDPPAPALASRTHRSRNSWRPASEHPHRVARSLRPLLETFPVLLSGERSFPGFGTEVGREIHAPLASRSTPLTPVLFRNLRGSGIGRLDLACARPLPLRHGWFEL